MARPEHKKFYASARWKKTRAVVLARDDGLCRVCRKFGIVKPAIDIDHIKPMTTHPHLALTLDNLQALCKECHNVKTTADAKGAGGYCAHGYPVGVCCDE